jgi:DNA repair and recombination protein RAD52
MEPNDRLQKGKEQMPNGGEPPRPSVRQHALCRLAPMGAEMNQQDRDNSNNEAEQNSNNAFSQEERQRVGNVLKKKLGAEYLKRRQGPGGTDLVYISSDTSIELANRIFGFDRWSSSIVSLQTDYVQRNRNNGQLDAGCTSVVRVTLANGCYREDVGFGDARGSNQALVIGKCKKEAVSDARKRAFRLFGNALGNSVYDKPHAEAQRLILKGQRRQVKSDDLLSEQDLESLSSWSSPSSSSPSSLPSAYASASSVPSAHPARLNGSRVASQSAPQINGRITLQKQEEHQQRAPATPIQSKQAIVAQQRAPATTSVQRTSIQAQATAPAQRTPIQQQATVAVQRTLIQQQAAVAAQRTPIHQQTAQRAPIQQAIQKPGSPLMRDHRLQQQQALLTPEPSCSPMVLSTPSPQTTQTPPSSSSSSPRKRGQHPSDGDVASPKRQRMTDDQWAQLAQQLTF